MGKMNKPHLHHRPQAASALYDHSFLGMNTGSIDIRVLRETKIKLCLKQT